MLTNIASLKKIHRFYFYIRTLLLILIFIGLSQIPLKNSVMADCSVDCWSVDGCTCDSSCMYSSYGTEYTEAGTTCETYIDTCQGTCGWKLSNGNTPTNPRTNITENYQLTACITLRGYTSTTNCSTDGSGTCFDLTNLTSSTIRSTKTGGACSNIAATTKQYYTTKTNLVWTCPTLLRYLNKDRVTAYENPNGTCDSVSGTGTCFKMGTYKPFYVGAGLTCGVADCPTRSYYDNYQTCSWLTSAMDGNLWFQGVDGDIYAQGGMSCDISSAVPSSSKYLLADSSATASRGGIAISGNTLMESGSGGYSSRGTNPGWNIKDYGAITTPSYEWFFDKLDGDNVPIIPDLNSDGMVDSNEFIQGLDAINPPQTITIQPFHEGIDCFVAETNPDTPYPLAFPMLVGGMQAVGTHPARSLLKFDLSAMHIYGEVSNATMSLYIGKEDDTTNKANMYQVTSPWDENTTWNSQPTHDTTVINVLDPGPAPVGNYVLNTVTNITQLVDDWISGVTPNYGFMFVGQTETGRTRIGIATSDIDIPALRYMWPKLEVQYRNGNIKVRIDADKLKIDSSLNSLTRYNIVVLVDNEVFVEVDPVLRSDVKLAVISNGQTTFGNNVSSVAGIYFSDDLMQTTNLPEYIGDIPLVVNGMLISPLEIQLNRQLITSNENLLNPTEKVILDPSFYFKMGLDERLLGIPKYVWEEKLD